MSDLNKILSANPAPDALPKTNLTPAGEPGQTRFTPPDLADQKSVEAMPVSSPAEALSKEGERNRSPLDRLLALIPVDKQAAASSLLIELIKDARDNGAPVDPRKSKLAIGKGTQYRRSERRPLGTKL